MHKNEKIVIVGKSGSGKDHLLRGLLKFELPYSPKLTTRPKRNSETNGIEYNFIGNDQFNSLLENNQIKAYQHFLIEGKDWYYAISKENFDENQLFIMTPHEIEILSQEDRKKCFIVYLDISEAVRRKRIQNRSDNNDSIERRIKADDLDFRGFTEYDLKITDPEFDSKEVYELMN
jgi:guanylate kinase